MNEKTLNECSREELLKIIASLRKQKKFGLVWEDKPELVATECTVKLPVVKEVPEMAVVSAETSAPTNIIIEGDNYHALSVLNYTHAGKVDVIYIDPPYNTGARDWKYNNDYVDSNDMYRHSKWLSMMEKRLKLAKSLLNPVNSTLICTIDEKEFIHLGCLLEQIFPEAKIQMVTILINLSGTGRTNEFTRTNEFAFFVTIGEAKILPIVDESVKSKSVTWAHLHRSEITNGRAKTKAQFYPIFVDDGTKRIVEIGEPLPVDVDRHTVKAPDGCTAVFPVRDDEIETMWGCTPDELRRRVEKGYVRVGTYRPNHPQKYAIGYLKTGVIKDIESGVVEVTGYDDRGAVIASYNSGREKMPTTVLTSPLYDANRYGTKVVTEILGPGKFPYPKSLFAVEDCLKFVIKNNTAATVLDFFAGSGTTGHAVLELNRADGGNRRFILCTNNENKIAEEVTYPRIKAVVEGYADTESIPANVRYFKTDFVEKDETIDKLRRKLSPACEDMIRIREGAFDKVIDEDKFKVYKNSRGLTAVIFDRFELADYIAHIEELETDAPVHLYVFSYTNYGRLDELSDDLKHTYESQPIPEGVLEIYKRIFSKGGKK